MSLLSDRNYTEFPIGLFNKKYGAISYKIEILQETDYFENTFYNELKKSEAFNHFCKAYHNKYILTFLEGVVQTYINNTVRLNNKWKAISYLSIKMIFQGL